MASRDPTPKERSAIAEAARHTEGSPTQRVQVRDIQVSTVDPWATAKVTIYLRRSSQPEQAAVDTFYEAHGDWLDTADVDTSERAMPLDDEKNLGLSSPGRFGGVYLEIYLLVCWFFGLAGLVDVLLQPRDAFRAAGHSKLRWLLIELVGLGVFTWAFYAIKIRPSVVRAGGRPPRKLLHGILAALGERAPNSPHRTPPP